MIFLLDTKGNVAEEYESGDLIYQNVWSTTGPLNTRLTYDSDSITATTWALTDELGSSMAIYVNHDSVYDMERFLFDPSGEIRYLDATWEPLVEQESGFGWAMSSAGGQWDSTSGLYLRRTNATSARLQMQLQALSRLTATDSPPSVSCSSRLFLGVGLRSRWFHR